MPNKTPLYDIQTNPIEFDAPVRFTELPENPVEVSIGSTTPSVLNLTRLRFNNTGATTVTNFLNGQEGQSILLIGDGQTTVQNNSNILTNSAADKLLAVGIVYTFTYVANQWKESSGGGGAGPAGPPGPAGPTGPTGPAGPAGTNGTTVLAVHGDATANITMTNQAVAEQFLANNNRNIWLLDLAAATEVRLVARVVTASASVNNPRIRVRYATSFTTSLGSYADIGTSEVACSLAATGVANSGWVALAAGAQIAACYVAVTQIGGDAAADPALGNVQLWIR